MMRYCLLILLVSILFLSAGAQNKFDKEFYIGAKGGVTFSQVRFYPNVEQHVFQGRSAGLMLRMISEPHIGIQMEFNYMQKGWQEKPFAETSPDYYYHSLTYFEVPVMTHVNLGKRAVRFTLNLGPSVAFLVDDEQGVKPSGTYPDESVTSGEQYWNEPIKSKIDFLFTGGLGMEVRMKKAGILALEGRIYYSLPNLFDSDLYRYKSSQSNGALVTLAYLFRLDRKK